MLSIYKASAGSGKTFTLAYEYVRLLLGEKNNATGKYSLRKSADSAHRHILAITFTNKATEVMKSRIIEELARLAGMGGGRSDYREMLLKDFGCEAEELTVLARKTLHQLLFDFNYFNVSTIDSFFQTILRTFAREAELSGDYVLSVKGDDVMAESVHRFFDSLSHNSGDKSINRLIHSITRFLVEEFYGGKSVMLFNREAGLYESFLKTVSKLSSEKFIKSFDEFREFFNDPEKIERFETALASRISLLRSNVIKEAKTALREIEKLPDIYNDKKSGEMKKPLKADLIKCIGTLAAVGEVEGKTVANIVEKGVASFYYAGCRSYMETSPAPECEAAVTRAAEAALEQAAETPLLKEVRTNLFYLTMMAHVHRYMEEYRKDNNALLLSDTNAIVHSIIAGDDTPFIYERLGLQLDHYLIDEFQDTSRMQWQNLLPLVREGLSRNRDSLVIGDEKQCIYRFRNSDPTLLQHEVEQEFADECRVKGAEPHENTNWRSSADVIDFNNRLFSAIAGANGAEEIYSNVCQQVSPKHRNHRGYVCFTPVEASRKDDYAEQVLERLADDIDRQLEAGYNPSEIAVLTRNNGEGRAIITYLIDRQRESGHRYNVVSDELMRVSQSPAVSLIVNTLRSLAYPGAAGGQEKKYKTRRDTMAMISRYELSLHNGCSASEAMDAAVSGTGLGTGGEYSSPTLVELVEDIISDMNPEIVRTQNCFICAFHDILSDYSTTGLNDIRSFLRWWDESGRFQTISAPADPNAVRVMTIHKSKGLEFECVHIPFANWKVLNFSDVRWFKADPLKGVDAETPSMLLIKPSASLADTQFAEQYGQMCQEAVLDELNVLYVGFTRAIDELCVCYGVNSEIGEMIGNALDKEFAGSLNPDGQYVIGAPVCPQRVETAAQTDIETVVIDGYPTSGIPEGEDFWNIDYNPDEVE